MKLQISMVVLSLLSFVGCTQKSQMAGILSGSGTSASSSIPGGGPNPTPAPTQSPTPVPTLSVTLVSQTISPSSLYAGQSILFSAQVLSNQTLTGPNVTLYFTDSSGNFVDPDESTVQTNLTANTSYTALWTYTIPQGQGLGTYLVGVKVRSSDFSVSYLALTNIGSFTVTASSLPTPVPTATPTPQPSPSPTSKITPPPNMKIMPLGDSITYGVWSTTALDNAGYRFPLYNALNNIGLSFQFVGSVEDIYNGAPEADASVLLNEGHPGYAIADIASNIDNWLALNPPNLILLMIGTNDILAFGGGGNTASSVSTAQISAVATNLDNLIRQIAKNAPTARIIVSTILPMGTAAQLRQTSSWATLDANLNYNSIVQAYNALIPGVVAGEQQSGINITWVDGYSALSSTVAPNPDQQDGVHPNDTGYGVLEGVWYNGISAVYKLP